LTAAHRSQFKGLNPALQLSCGVVPSDELEPPPESTELLPAGS
jgi:hypothetical protein